MQYLKLSYAFPDGSGGRKWNRPFLISIPTSKSHPLALMQSEFFKQRIVPRNGQDLPKRLKSKLIKQDTAGMKKPLDIGCENLSMRSSTIAFKMLTEIPALERPPCG